MYADNITPSMRAAMDETERRRNIQDAYNQANGIEPKTIIKSVRDLIEISSPTAERKGRNGVKMTKAEKEKEIARLEKQMKEAARVMEYEYAALLRDQIIELRGSGL
jgi:excinuclease ABC subunit B